MKKCGIRLLAKGVGCMFVAIGVMACLILTFGLVAQRLIQLAVSSR